MLSGPVRKLSPHYYWNVNAEHANAAPAAKLSSGPGHLRSIYAVQFRASKKGFQRDNLVATITSISRAWASAKTFLRSIRSFLAREPVSLNTPTMWWSARWRTSGDRVPSAVSAACVAAGPTNGESRTDGARHCDRNVEDDRNGGADYSSLRRPQCRASQPLPAGP